MRPSLTSVLIFCNRLSPICFRRSLENNALVLATPRSEHGDGEPCLVSRTLKARSQLGGKFMPDKKPNIILINSDDFGYGDMGAYGGGDNRGMATPQPRPDGGRGHAVPLVLWPAELHAGTRGDGDRPHPQSQRHDDGRLPGPGRRPAGSRMDARLGAQDRRATTRSSPASGISARTITRCRTRRAMT